MEQSSGKHGQKFPCLVGNKEGTNTSCTKQIMHFFIGLEKQYEAYD